MCSLLHIIADVGQGPWDLTKFYHFQAIMPTPSIHCPTYITVTHLYIGQIVKHVVQVKRRIFHKTQYSGKLIFPTLTTISRKNIV